MKMQRLVRVEHGDVDFSDDDAGETEGIIMHGYIFS
jgi:hypothetical protein